MSHRASTAGVLRGLHFILKAVVSHRSVFNRRVRSPAYPWAAREMDGRESGGSIVSQTGQASGVPGGFGIVLEVDLLDLLTGCGQ